MLDEAHGRRLDRIYRYQRHFYDLTRKYYLVGRDTLIEGLLPPEDGSILEIGCGTGRNLVMAATRYPGTRLYGLDLSRRMLDTAEAKAQRAGLAHRITFAHADATSFDAAALFGRSDFDRVFLSYSLSMMPGWQRVIEHAISHVAPGGSLHIIDFGDGEGLPKSFNVALRAWLRRFDVEPVDDLARELQKLASSASVTVFKTPVMKGYALYAVVTPESKGVEAARH